MMDTSLNRSIYKKRAVNIKGPEFLALIRSSDAFICAAGFEARAARAPLAAKVIKNPIVVAYKHGPAQNDKTLRKFVSIFNKVQGFDICELDLTHAEKYETSFESTLRKLQNLQTGKIILDISGLPNFAICISVMKIRHVFPTVNLILLYTEAEEYFPQKKDFERIKQRAVKEKADIFPEYLSTRAVNLFVPSMFSGVALGHNDTCLIVYAGYEPHRSNCVVEAMNPSKLVMIYGEPERPDLKWRLELSQIMHRGIDHQQMKTEEVVSTSDLIRNRSLLVKYYDYLYDDHIICVCPNNSKIQAVASALAWETYPDIQLVFSVPSEYLPKRFSLEWRDTFVIDLGISLVAQRFQS